MELTPAEARLINGLREIDRRNPAGIDGMTAAAYLDMFQPMVDGAAVEGERRYKLFIAQTKGGGFVDLREAQRRKLRHEDTRQRAEAKAEYEANYKKWGLPAPERNTGAPAAPDLQGPQAAANKESSPQDRKPGPLYSFSCGNAFVDGRIIAGMEDDEAAALAADYEAVCTRINPDGSRVIIYEPGKDVYYSNVIWGEAEPGTMEHAVKFLDAPAAAIAAALEVLTGIRQACEDEAAAEGLRNEFDYEPAPDLLAALRQRVEVDRQRKPATVV